MNRICECAHEGLSICCGSNIRFNLCSYCSKESLSRCDVCEDIKYGKDPDFEIKSIKEDGKD